MSACLIHKVQFAQVRAVSNLVERRNRESWKMAEAITNLNVDGAAHPRITHDPHARLLAVPERLLHVRRDRERADRSRRARVHAAPRRRRGAEQGGVRGRGRRHEAELSRLRLLHRRLRAARRRQRARTQLRAAADLEAADRAGRGRGGQAAASRSPASTPPRTSCSAWRSRRRRNKTPLVFSEIESALLDDRFDAGLIIHENRFTYAGQGAEEDHRPRRVLGRRRPARRFRSAASSSSARCPTR